MWYVSYSILGLFAIFPLLWRLDASTIFASIFNCAGSWIRYFAKSNIYFTMIGQLMVALSQILLCPTPAFLAEIWFSNEERVVASTVAYLASCLGNAVGFLASCFFVGENPDKIPKYLLYSSFLMSFCVILCLAFMRNKPKKPANNTSN